MPCKAYLMKYWRKFSKYHLSGSFIGRLMSKERRSVADIAKKGCDFTNINQLVSACRSYYLPRFHEDMRALRSRHTNLDGEYEFTKSELLEWMKENTLYFSSLSSEDVTHHLTCLINALETTQNIEKVNRTITENDDSFDKDEVQTYYCLSI